MKPLYKLALLFFTLTLFACGNSASGGGSGENPTQPLPKISIADATGDEGGMLNFKVTSDLIATVPINFDYKIEYQTATANDLMRDINTIPQIEIGKNSTTVSVIVVNDNFRESAETFTITLMNPSPSGTTIINSTATGAIATNDTDGIKTSLSIADAQGREGGMLNFKVTIAQAIAEPISFNYRVDFDNSQNSASIDDLSGKLTGMVHIATNDSSVTISIVTANDSLRENFETFLIILSNLNLTDATFTDNIGRGTILANDNNGTGIVTISAEDAEASEDTGKINFRVSSEFPAVTGSPFTFNYAVVLDNPTTPNSANFADFDATTGTATIPADSDSTTISIKIATDDTIEPDETFSLRLTPTSANVILANNLVTGTILNDDLGEISDATAIVGYTEMTLKWTNPVSNLFAGVTIAYVIASPNAPADCSSAGTVDAGKATSHTLRSLANGLVHSILICARSTDDSLSSGVPLANLIANADNDGNGLIEIANPTQFNNIRHNLDATSYKTRGGGTPNNKGCPNNICSGYELTANIPLSGTWNPIGSSSNGFTAILEGNNKTISNLTIAGNNDYVGLFSAMEDATIRNLKLANVDISGGGNVGALVGQATGTTALSNIELIGDESQSSSDAEIKGTGSNVGGLVGIIQNSSTITDASSSLTVRGGATEDVDNTGGLVGQLQSGSIKNSNSSGSVSSSGGADNVGGLVGKMDSGVTISNSWASGNVSSTGSNNINVGGLVGLNNGNISNSWASGNVSGNTAGGLVGGIVFGNISNSWASGNVSGNSAIGGLVGAQGPGPGQVFVADNHIRQSWASGNVSGNTTGGLVGLSLLGTIHPRNYQLDGAGANLTTSFHLASTADLASLSGASGGTATTDSNWHTGFGTANSQDNFRSRFCDTNGNGTIDVAEQVATNSVWVMPSEPTGNGFPTGMSDNVLAPTTDTARNPAMYYAIPAIRCIANTAGITNQTTIDEMRKIEIDRQRRHFPQ